MRRPTLLASVFLAARVAAGAVTIARLAAVARPSPPVRPTITPLVRISVVVPARDEADRIGPLLATVVGAPGVHEVLVVDDESSDATAEIARHAGATVISGVARPPGWAGKAWALQQGIEASSGEWIVTLDADTRPDPALPTALVARAIGERLDLLTVGGRFDCPTPASRWLHASMLTTLVYRFGAPGRRLESSGRAMANGQCMAFARDRLVDSGALHAVRGAVVEDIALAREIAGAGGRVAFLDAGDHLTVRMFESFDDVRRGWGRSIALPGVESRRRQIADLAVVVLAQAMPLPRLVTRRGDLVDVVLALVRVGTLAGTRRAYTAGGMGYWLSPLADPLAAATLAVGIGRGTRQTWRGRSYG